MVDIHFRREPSLTTARDCRREPRVRSTQNIRGLLELAKSKSHVEVIRGLKAREKMLCIADLVIGDKSEEEFLQQATQRLIDATGKKSRRQISLSVQFIAGLLTGAVESRDVKLHEERL